jgi:hypothetical protein
MGVGAPALEDNYKLLKEFEMCSIIFYYLACVKSHAQPAFNKKKERFLVELFNNSTGDFQVDIRDS